MLAKTLQQSSAVPQRLISSIKVQDCLPESLTDEQILFSLRGKTCLLTTAPPHCPVPAQTWMAWKQLSQLSFSGHAAKRGEPRLKGAFKAREKLQTQHWSSCPLLLTPALSQADHGHGPAEVLRWDWRDMVSLCPNGISYFFREGIMSSSWHLFPESSWPTKLVVTPVLHPFQDSESVSQALLSPKRFLNAFMVLVIPSSCLFPQEKQGLGLIKLCCQLSGSESWFALEHAFLAALMTVSHFQIWAKQDLASVSLERKHKFLPLFLSHSTQQLTTLLSRYPEFIKTSKYVTIPRTRQLGIDFWLGARKMCCRTAVNRQQQMLHTEFPSFHVENVLLVLQRLLLSARQAGAIVSSNFRQTITLTVLLQSFLNTLDFCEGPAKTK